MFVPFVLLLCVINSNNGITSPITPFTVYDHSVELQTNVADLWWTVNETNQTIVFELHVNTTGWIALGISPAGGMIGADIGVGWVDQSGTVYFQDRYAYAYAPPVIDNTTTDWFALQGREQNGWTAIQFKRLLDTCDYMDVPIASGTDYLIFAYGLVDPSLCLPISDITYHQDRKGEAILSLRSYSDPPLESTFASLDYFDFQLNNYTIPADDTTYYCKIYKAPTNYSTKRHVIAHKILINSTNPELVHHLLMYECDPSAQFNDSDLPEDLCDNINDKTNYCTANIATGWAVGGQRILQFPAEAGYPVGGNFSVKYYLVQIHYNNPKLLNNATDSSGIRFYVTDQLRQYDIGYLTFGTDPSPLSLAIPPHVQSFAVDSYCPVNASTAFPSSGISVVSAFPHTHLQGISIWTKIIRNNTAVQYLYNDESYNFNYQFDNRLPQPIKLYPGDTFVTRCVYSTMNKDQVTLGGDKTTNEMCLHRFTYYPRVNNLYACLSLINIQAWGNFLNNSAIDQSNLGNYITNISWTPNLADQWQSFYNNASRLVLYGRSGYLNFLQFPQIPNYVDLKQENCTAQQSPYNSTNTTLQCSLSTQQTQYNSTNIPPQSSLSTQQTQYNSTNTPPQLSLATRRQIFINLLGLPLLMKILIYT